MNFLDLIKEGRVEDFKSKYGNKFSDNQINKIIKSILPKYLMWVGKTIDPIDFERRFQSLFSTLLKFEKIGSNLPKTDINAYKSFDELLSAIETFQNREKRDFKQVQGGNLVYDDGKIFVVNPLDHTSSCYYGRGTKWCTASSTDTAFRNYNNEGKLFYIIDRTKPTDDPLYKVAYLRKFDGNKIFYNAVDDRIDNGWIFGTNQFKSLSEKVEQYLEDQFGEQLEIWKNVELAEKERQRQNRMEEERRLLQKRNAAEERRLNGEWDLSNPNIDEEGLKANALLNYLIETGEVDDDDPDDDNYMDVYNIIPAGVYYSTSEFEIIDNDDLESNRYAVGTDYEMDSSSVSYLEDIINDEGVGAYNRNFLYDFIDDEAVIEYALEFYQTDIRDNAEDYFDESLRMLSPRQQERVDLFRNKIEQNEKLINLFKEKGNTEWFSKKITELEEINEEYLEEIGYIESDPDGDFPEEIINQRIEDNVNWVRQNITRFLDDFGLNYDDFINEKELIRGIIDHDGYGQILNHYDGGAWDISVKGKLFYVMRID